MKKLLMTQQATERLIQDKEMRAAGFSPYINPLTEQLNGITAFLQKNLPMGYQFSENPVIIFELSEVAKIMD
jgi:hypothetical protein